MNKDDTVHMVATCIIKDGQNLAIGGVVSKELADKMCDLFRAMFKWQNENPYPIKTN